MTDFDALLRTLTEHKVAFIVIGGAAAIELQLFGRRCLCLSLPQLIRAKRAAGRPRDLEALAELETIAEETVE